MSDTLSGIVINLNAYGATVRLDDGNLATASPSDVQTNRDRYQRSFDLHKRVAFEVRRQGRRCAVSLAPQIRDDEFEAQIAAFLKSTQEWEPDDAVPAADRHFLRKKRRAELFQLRRT